MKKVSKTRAMRCTSHHSACDCREYQFRYVQKILKGILKRAKDHPTFDEDLFLRRNFEGLAEIGGDVFDWTVMAIEAYNALNPLTAKDY